MKTLLHIVLNRFTHDARVIKAATVGVENSFDTWVYALHEDELAINEEERGYHIRRFPIITRSWSKQIVVQLLKYKECVIRMLLAGIKLRPSIVHAHDLNALPIGYLISVVTGAHLIYDSHELWSDPSHKKNWPSWIFSSGKIIEKWLSKRAHTVITVSDGVGHELLQHLRRQPVIIRNVPFTWQQYDKEKLLLRKALNISKETFVLLSQGVVAKSRGAYLLLDAFPHLHDNCVLVFLGNGAEVPDLSQKVQEMGLSDKILFYPAVSPDELPLYTQDADVGIAPIIPICKSYYYTLPNKLMEYIQGGLAVCVSNLPDMSNIVNQYKTGVIFDINNPNDLIANLNHLLSNKQQLAEYKKASQQAAKELNWSIEKQKLEKIYRLLS